MKLRVAAAVAFVLLLGAAAVLYAADFDGIPDDGPVPVPMLAAFLFHLRNDDVRTLWLLACLAYVLPPLLTSTRSTREGLLTSGAVMAASLCLLRLPEGAHTDYVPTFSVELLVEGLVWLVGLSAIGVGLGTLVRLTRVDRSKSGSHQGRST
ncbi:MAG: hypothetical protein QM817_30930 [Archangium sp.]